MANTAKDFMKENSIFKNGYGVIPKLVMFCTELSIESKAIYSYFCVMCGVDGKCYPSRDKILSDLNMSKEYYYKHLRILKEKSFLIVEKKVIKNKKGKYYQRNTYILEQNPNNLNINQIELRNNKQVTGYKGFKKYGYGFLSRSIMLRRDLDIKSKAIYAYFSSYNGFDESVFPLQNDILKHLNISSNTYLKYRKDLIKVNLIEVFKRKADDGKFIGNEYHLTKDISKIIGNVKYAEDEKKEIKIKQKYKAIDKKNKKPSTKVHYIDKANSDQPPSKIPYMDLLDTNNTTSNIFKKHQSTKEGLDEYFDYIGLNDQKYFKEEYHKWLNTIKQCIKFIFERKSEKEILKLKDLNVSLICEAIDSYEKAIAHIKIRKPVAYLSTILLNEIDQSFIKNESAIRLELENFDEMKKEESLSENCKKSENKSLLYAKKTDFSELTLLDKKRQEIKGFNERNEEIHRKYKRYVESCSKQVKSLLSWHIEDLYAEDEKIFIKARSSFSKKIVESKYLKQIRNLFKNIGSESIIVTG